MMQAGDDCISSLGLLRRTSLSSRKMRNNFLREFHGGLFLLGMGGDPPLETSGNEKKPAVVFKSSSVRIGELSNAT
jgi:hypothetical protein